VVHARLFTDPACPESWGLEPQLRRLILEFAADLSFAYVMGGLARTYEGGHERRIAAWLDRAETSGMPLDPRLWTEGPIASSYPACMAVKAAAEQGAEAEARYLRTLREGLMCFRRKLDTTEALVEQARRARLDVERFRVDLGSHAIVESFGADLEKARDVPDAAREAGVVVDHDGHERVPFPSVAFAADGADPVWVFGARPYEAYRDAAQTAGASPGGEPAPEPLAAVARFGTLATREVQEVCDLPEPRAAAELWRLASEWKLKPVRVLTGHLWETA
jgi:putative protein-disulfide isomerase